jgi:hypothetical protein
MAEYTFLSTWCLEAPAERIFDVINELGDWPAWWRGVERTELLEEGAASGVGRLWRCVWRSRLPYELGFDLRVTRVERPWLLEGEAQGELSGTGRWRFYEGRDSTAVVYEWNVRTTRWWMNLLAPLARPAFAWNHDVVMRQGAIGLSRRLGAPLIAHD